MVRSRFVRPEDQNHLGVCHVCKLGRTILARPLSWSRMPTFRGTNETHDFTNDVDSKNPFLLPHGMPRCRHVQDATPKAFVKRAAKMEGPEGPHKLPTSTTPR